MNRGWVLLLLAGCAGDPGEPNETEPTTEAPPTSEVGACELTASVPVGWTEPALGSTPSDLFASATGVFAGDLSLSDGPIPVTLDIDPDLGEIMLVTRAWRGEGDPEDCASTVEASFAARFWSDDAAIDATFSSVLAADGHSVRFAAWLPTDDAALAEATTASELAINGDLDPPGVWSGWVTWGPETESAAWFEVASVP